MVQVTSGGPLPGRIVVQLRLGESHVQSVVLRAGEAGTSVSTSFPKVTVGAYILTATADGIKLNIPNPNVVVDIVTRRMYRCLNGFPITEEPPTADALGCMSLQ